MNPDLEVIILYLWSFCEVLSASRYVSLFSNLARFNLLSSQCLDCFDLKFDVVKIEDDICIYSLMILIVIYSIFQLSRTALYRVTCSIDYRNIMTEEV